MKAAGIRAAGKELSPCVSPGARFPLGVLSFEGKNTFPTVLLGAGLGLHVPPKVSAAAVSLLMATR